MSSCERFKELHRQLRYPAITLWKYFGNRYPDVCTARLCALRG